MSAVELRVVEEGDLAELYEQQRDPVACEMAAFPARDRAAFMAHWQKVLADDKVIRRTILADGKVAGYIVCYEHAGETLIGYWVGRSFWGQGIASRALAELVSLVPTRPLQAHVAKSNVASIRVLEKCGFRRSGDSASAAPTGGEAVGEYVFALL